MSDASRGGDGVAILLAGVEAGGATPLATVGPDELAALNALNGPVVDGAAAAWWAALGDGERSDVVHRGRRSLHERGLLHPADGPSAALGVALLARARPSVVALGVTAGPGPAGAPWLVLYGVAEEAAGLRWVLEEQTDEAGGARRWAMATPGRAAEDLAAWACAPGPDGPVVRTLEVVHPDPAGPRRQAVVVETTPTGSQRRPAAGTPAVVASAVNRQELAATLLGWLRGA